MLLLDLPAELLHSICLSQTMICPNGGASLSLLSMTCTVFGKPSKKGGQSLVTQLAQTFCKDAGVCRLPSTMGDGWCWPRMLSWLSQAVRVGPQHELKTIRDGVFAADLTGFNLIRTKEKKKNAHGLAACSHSSRGAASQSETPLAGAGTTAGGATPAAPIYAESNGAAKVALAKLQGSEGGNFALRLVEGSSLVLVEPGVYDEGLRVASQQRVSIWGCDRESDSASSSSSSDKTEKEMMALRTKKVEWVSRDKPNVAVFGLAVVAINGMQMKPPPLLMAVQPPPSEEANEEGGVDESLVQRVRGALQNLYPSATAENGATLTLEGCDLTRPVQARGGATVRLSNCCVHDAVLPGVCIGDKSSGTLENNEIHSNDAVGVLVSDEGTEVLMRNNHIHDSNGTGVFVVNKAKAVLESNTITDNDLEGVQVVFHSTVEMSRNTIKGNGQCKIERPEEELATWPPAAVALYRAGTVPGVRIRQHSTATTQQQGSNTIEGNGRLGNGVSNEWMVDDSSTHQLDN